MTRTVLAGGCVLDVESGSVARADVVLDGERIATVGQDAGTADEVVDCSGGLIIPGLIDCHAHVAFPQQGELPRSARLFEAAAVLRSLLARGVTTVRDAWGADAGFPLALDRGWLRGPDLLITLRQLSPTGGLGDSWSPRYGSADAFGDPSLPDPLFDGADSARAAVRRMVRAGADWIKLGASGSIGQGAAAHDVQPTEAELHAVVDEAARHGGRAVMAHAHGARAVEAAARAGVRSIEHGIWLDEDAAEAMVTAGCWYVPTLSPATAIPEAATAHRRSLRLALDAGIPVAAGSDLAPRPHVDLHTELRLLAEAGLGPAGALRAATAEAARLLRLDHDRGRVAEGLGADLVLLRGTDLDVTDLANRVAAVWQRGELVAR